MDVSISENETVCTDNVNQDAIPHVQAVETRTMKRKRDAPVQPLKVPGPISEISPKELKNARERILVLNICGVKLKEMILRQKGMSFS